MVHIRVRPAVDGTGDGIENSKVGASIIKSNIKIDGLGYNSIIPKTVYTPKESMMTATLRVEHLLQEADQYRRCLLYECLKPLLFSLKICGMHHRKSFQKIGPSKYSISRICSLILVIILWLNVIRMLSMFNKDDKFGPLLFMKIIFIGWVLLCTVNVSCCFYSCENINCLSRFFLQWKSLHLEDTDTYCINYVKPRALIYMIVCWILIILHVIFANYLCFRTVMMDSMITPFSPTGNYNILWRVLSVSVIQTWLMCCWILPMGLVYTICVIIYSEYNALNKSFQSQIDQDGKFNGCLGNVRIRHQAITRMVGYADNFLKIMLAESLLTDIILICLIMYNIIYYPGVMENPMAFFISIVWLVSCFANMLVISVGPAFVNGKVRYYAVQIFYRYP